MALSPASYAPTTLVQCPPGSDLLRSSNTQNHTLNPLEAQYISAKLNNTAAWKTWLNDGSGIGYNLDTLLSNPPKIGIALSAGGYRAAQYGAGVLSALDARNATASSSGTGGLLQVSSYLSAASGGAWLATSLIFNDFPTMHQLVLGDGNGLSGWLLDQDLLLPASPDINDASNQALYTSVLNSIVSKANKGFGTTITDIWGRLLSYHFLNGTTEGNFFDNSSPHGAGQLWSQIPQFDIFTSQSLPFPIIAADARPPGSGYNMSSQPVWPTYEFTPYEFGSWYSAISAFVNITIAGTVLSGGSPANSTACVEQFDEAGFIMGTSSSFFNTLFNNARTQVSGFDSASSNVLVTLLKQLEQRVQVSGDTAAYWPNPFFGHNLRLNTDGSYGWLELVDGGSNGEDVPLTPLLVNGRALDTIVVVDGSNDDAENWPEGRSLYATDSRTSKFLSVTHQQMPPLPSNPTDFANLGLNQRPTFFGCDPTKSPPEFPLLIYLPNSPPNDGSDPITNTDTYRTEYSLEHTELFLDRTQNNTMGGFVPFKTGADPNWPKCLQCAAIDRARLLQTSPPARSSTCTACFQQYCYNPSSPPPAGQIVGRKIDFVDPDPTKRQPANNVVEEHKVPFGVGLGVGLAVLIGVAVALCFWRRRRRGFHLRRASRYKQVIDEDTDAWRTRGTSFELPRLGAASEPPQ